MIEASIAREDTKTAPFAGLIQEIAVSKVVERAGFEPAYACAGRFTVCLEKAEDCHFRRPMYHFCIARLLRKERGLCSRR